jgi:hypothetical protein
MIFKLKTRIARMNTNSGEVHGPRSTVHGPQSTVHSPRSKPFRLRSTSTRLVGGKAVRGPGGGTPPELAAGTAALQPANSARTGMSAFRVFGAIWSVLETFGGFWSYSEGQPRSGLFFGFLQFSAFFCGEKMAAVADRPLQAFASRIRLRSLRRDKGTIRLRSLRRDEWTIRLRQAYGATRGCQIGVAKGRFGLILPAK